MGDFSRDTNDPRKHYSGVLMQQGRVQLDADWNEQLALQLYRTELEARDVIGACGVPKKVGGFEIGLAPGGQDLTISPGRIYVDGLLCESDAARVPIRFVQNAPNRAEVDNLWVDGGALAQGQWVEISAANKSGTDLLRITDVDTQLHRLTFGANVTAYQNQGPAHIRRVATLLTQPDFPAASIADLITGGASAQPASPPTQSPLGSPPSSGLADGVYLVFLHAWKREVTALDDPHIREVALGGPDTATRLKNIWQVKLLRVGPSSPPTSPAGSPPTSPPGGDLKCGSDFAEWDALVAAPTGLMNAQTKPPQDEIDPCLLPPTAGFTRLENQLYRVEVQRGGARGEATFKWSRDNAVVRTSITDVNGAVLTVADVGRDEVLGFAGGQWVEITDEESVLKGAPRQLAQIDQIDPTTREVTLKTTPTGLNGRKNLQLVRWDQTADVGADGVAMTDDWIDLEGGVQVLFTEGVYRAGDFWLIPARTATGEIEWPPFARPNTDPAAQPPLGVQHHFCRLALVQVFGGQIAATNIKDCRELFPSLTDICAEDICVSNTACDLPDVENLQDMLDRLCAARDLRWHNKHLHGWGIVCGLQVECGPDPQGPRQHVTVRPGYALDCEGRDIVLDAPRQLNLVNMAAQSSPPFSTQNGEVSLRLELDAEGRKQFRLEPYVPPQNELKELLAGTILLDFYNDCVKPLVEFVQEEFTPNADAEPALVGPARKRAITFGNLFIQYMEPINGSRVFLSGDSAQPNAESEHTILRDSFNRLRELLQSHTFCAMFEGARPFPNYPYASPGINTIFGRGNQKRVRINPSSTRAYAVGWDNHIDVYDLTTNALVERLEFPGGANAVVSDVAFSANGSQLYAAATLGPADSLFAVADIQSGRHFWRTPSVVCAAHILSLATSASVNNRVFAAGKGKGLYEIDLSDLTKPPTLRHAFNAVGHLVISNQPLSAWATASSQSVQTDVYDRVLQLNLTGTAGSPTPFFFQTVGGAAATGSDDIAFVPAPGNSAVAAPRLFMVINPLPNTTTKHVVIFNAVSNTAGSSVTNLGENTRIRLAHNPVTSHMMVTYEDSYRVGLLDPSTNQVVANFSHPVQLKPLSIAVAPNQGHVYVLNFVSNTINKIPAGRFTPNNALPLQPLIDYRAAVLEAYTDLWAGLFQYLKDCFCDHLLVNCPTCDDEEDGKIYLANIRFREGQVFKVCNFSGRKYVKSFPTVEYWLSVFPIIPLVGKMVEKICCEVFPSLFSRFRAERSTVSENGINVADSRVSGEQYESGVTFAGKTNFRAAFVDQMLKLTEMRQVAQESVSTVIAENNAAPPEEETSSVSTAEFTGLKIEEAKAKLEAAGVVVDNVERYEPRRAARNLARIARAPRKLRAGTRVTLVEQDGVVRLAEEAPSQLHAFREELSETKAAVAETRDAIARTDALQQEVGDLRRELAERDKVIAELRESTGQLREHAETLRTLKEQVDSIRSVVRIPQPDESGKTEAPTTSLKSPAKPQSEGGGEGKKPPGKGGK